MILGSFGYLHAPWRRSTKPFTTRSRRCEGKSTCISCFFALCSPSAQSLNMVRFSWSWTRSDTFTLHEDAPQNRLQNGYAIVKVSPLVFHVFLPDAHHLLSHLIWSIFIILDSFGYLHAPWRCSTKPFTKRLSRCEGKSTCISFFLPYAHHLLSHLIWAVFHDLGLVLIPPRSVKTLHKTVYETVKLLWR